MLASARAEAERHGVSLAVLRASGSVDRLPQLLARHARLHRSDHRRPARPRGARRRRHRADRGRVHGQRPSGAGDPARRLRPCCRRGGADRAWDGSREAARATSDAIPLLRLAERPWSWWSTPMPGRTLGAPPGAELAAHLVRHEVKAELRQVASGSAGIADVLLAQARDSRSRSAGDGRLRPLPPARDDARRHHPLHARADDRAVVDLPLMATEAPSSPCASEPCPAAGCRAEHAGVSGPMLLIEPSPARAPRCRHGWWREGLP